MRALGVDSHLLGTKRAYPQRRHRLVVSHHGLCIDNLLAAEVVTADGHIVRAGAEENQDLLSRCAA